METILFTAWAIITLIATLIVLVNAFKTSILWGLAVLLIPYAGLIYVFIHLNAKHIAVKLYLISVFVFFGGMIVQNL